MRPGTSDVTVYNETFTGLFHVPPEWMPVPSTVLDLGANIGLTAAHYKAMWPDARVVAVEPDPSSAAMARRNIGDDSVFVDECAVGGSAGRGRMSDGDHYSRRLERGEGGHVVVDTFRAIVDRHFPDGVDFVKVDVEGAEWHALREIPAGVRSLLVELHERPGRDDDVSMLLTAQRYLAAQCFLSQPHRIHPRAVFAWRG